MDLSDIKFTYQDKIVSVNNRIEKYEEIVKHYNKRIKKAEEKGIEDYSSLTSARKQYNNKIKNLHLVKRHYKEFVKTADYLLQNINSSDSLVWKMKCEGLEKRNDELNDHINELEGTIFEQERQLQGYETVANLDKTRIKELKNEVKYQKSRVKDAKNLNKTQLGLLKEENLELRNVKDIDETLKKENEELLKKVERLEKLEEENKRLKIRVDKIKKERTQLNNKKRKLDGLELKLTADKSRLLEEIDILERKNEQLENYCNHLLNRNNPIDWDKNIFEQVKCE